MKKILFLSIHLPYPVASGASMFNTFMVLKHLIRSHEVHFACLLKNDDPNYSDSFVKEIGLKQYYFEELNIPRSTSSYLRSLVKGIPLNILRNHSSSFAKKIREEADNYDIIWIDHYEAFQYLPSTFRGQSVLRLHNAWHMIWRRYSSVIKNPFLKISTLIEAARVRKFEKDYCKRADLVLCAKSDGENLEPNSNIRKKKFREFLFLGDDAQLELKVPEFESLENSLVYVGTLSWEPNVDGLIWFIESAWLELQRKHPEVKLYVIGKNPDERLKNIAAKFDGIELTGFVEDLEPYFLKCKVNIAPLRFGSGIKVKIINGLYRGIPMVTTTVGIESIDLSPGDDIVIADSPQEMVEGISSLFCDGSYWNNVSNNSRLLAQSKFRWKHLNQSIDEILEQHEPMQ